MPVRLASASYSIKTAFYALFSAAIMIYSLSLCGPRLGAAALALGLFFSLIAIHHSIHLVRNVLKRHPAVHPFSPNLGRLMAELCAAAGIPPGGITLVDFNAAEDAVKKMNDEKKKYA